MNRLYNLKYDLSQRHFNTFGQGAFVEGFDAATAEYEKIIAELKKALKFYSNSVAFHGAVALKGCILRDGGKVSREALQKLKEFRG